MPVILLGPVRQDGRVLEDRRLLQATQAALGPLLGPYGFTVTGSTERGRGSTVVCSSSYLEIIIVGDWLEGELTVGLRPVGGPAIPLCEVVDLAHARALSLSRLRRGVTAAMLQRRIEQIGELLMATIPGAIEGHEEALAALQQPQT